MAFWQNTTNQFIDSHCHLDFDVFDQDRAEILARCQQRGIEMLVIPGVQASQWSTLLNLCQQWPQLVCALGLHPYFLNDYQEGDLQKLSQQLTLGKAQAKRHVVAVGEIGIDALQPNMALQEEVFAAQLSLAKQHNLPVIVHHRKSHSRILKYLRQIDLPQAGVIHAFSGSKEEATAYLDLGFKFGIGGTITYVRAERSRALVAALPLEAMVLETDAPDMPLSGRQGKRNSPEYLTEVFAALAALRPESDDQLAAAIWQNTQRLFNLRLATTPQKSG